jgi:hypothetical protein
VLYLSYSLILSRKCALSVLSAVSFEAVLLVRGRLLSRERSGLGAAECGKPLVQAARYNASSLPHLRIQNR